MPVFCARGKVKTVKINKKAIISNTVKIQQSRKREDRRESSKRREDSSRKNEAIRVGVNRERRKKVVENFTKV